MYFSYTVDLYLVGGFCLPVKQSENTQKTDRIQTRSSSQRNSERFDLVKQPYYVVLLNLWFLS